MPITINTSPMKVRDNNDNFVNVPGITNPSAFLVTLNYDSASNTYTSDKTGAEVYNAYNSGVSPVFKFDIGPLMWQQVSNDIGFCANTRMHVRISTGTPKYNIEMFCPDDLYLGLSADTDNDYLTGRPYSY